MDIPVLEVEMSPVPGAKRAAVATLAIGTVAFALSGAVPALGGPSAFSAASVAATAKKALKLSKKADKNARAALALAKKNGPGSVGPTGPTGPTGATGSPGTPGAPGSDAVLPAGQGPFTVSTFANTWAQWATGYTVTYYKDPVGIVHLTGGIKNGTVSVGTASVPIFTLPQGFRPQQIHYQPIVSTDSSDVPVAGAYVEICQVPTCSAEDAGEVSVFGADNYFVGLDGISFRAGG